MSEPVVELFCVTYARDAEWTQWMIRSVQKYAFGFAGITVVFPEKDVPVFEPLMSEFRASRVHVRWVHEEEPEGAEAGHMNQNYLKCCADKYVPRETTHVVHIDSDCAFTGDFDSSELFEDGKPHLLFTPYDQLGNEADAPWRAITENALKFSCPAETMRKFPFIYPVWLYDYLRKWVEARNLMDFKKFVMTAPKLGRYAFHGFSEFNALGCFAKEQLAYHFHLYETSTAAPRYPLHQYWSHSLFTRGEREELKKITEGWENVK